MPSALIRVLRSTLECLENDEEFTPDDPVGKEFKAFLLRALANMAIRKATVELEDSLALGVDSRAA